MEHTALFCPSQTWKGPNVSTFSSEWDDALNSYLLAPDVIKPPPQFQDPEEPCQATPTNVAVVKKRSKDVVRAGAMQKERRSRPVSAMEHHRRSLSLSTTITSNPGATRRRCESYALSYPSSSSDDSGSDSSSMRKRDHLPDSVPQHKVRRIVLRKAKRRPDPPTRTVSLPGLTHVTPTERRTQSLYIPTDSQSTMLLPDLIPLSKEEAGECGKTTHKEPGDIPVNQTTSRHRSVKEIRSSDPCKASTGSSIGFPLNEPTKVSCNSDCNNSPSSSRSSPSQPSISSPTKPPGSASPSSGYSSQCETPTQPNVITAGACRMRPKPSGAVPGQQVRNCRSRLSLQLPETVSSTPEPPIFLPKVNRRYSDASHPKQRLSNSMLFMPVVTQEELNNVRLRSVSSSDLDTTAVIEEENERDAGSSTAQNSPKHKPPVAPKPPVSKRPPCAAAAAGSNSNTSSVRDSTGTNASYGQSSIYSSINKPRFVLPSSSNVSSDHKPQSQEHTKETSHFQSQCTNALSFKHATDAKPSEAQKKRRAPAPPVSKRPSTVSSACEDTSGLNIHVPSPPESSQREYHVTVYGLIPTYSQPGEKVPPHVAEYELYDKDDGLVTEIGALHLNDEDEVFLHKSSPHTTEDLFTIIHRSKRKLLGRKDSLDNKPGDFNPHTLGGVSKTTHQNDNFMALLRRTRSAKAGCGSRVSAAELLRSSKPAATTSSTDLSSYKQHNMMQNHSP